MAQTTTRHHFFVRRDRPGFRLIFALLAASIALTACSGDDESGEKDRSSAETVVTEAKIGVVRGRLPKAQANRTLEQVTTVVERWSDAAYAGSGSQQPKGAFATFTDDVRQQAAAQPALSNSRLKGDIGESALVRRVVGVDMLAARGKAVGATARVRIDVELPGLKRTDRITGRLLLTPTRGGWRIFGFDFSRNAGGAR